jgi:predicted ATPase
MPTLIQTAGTHSSLPSNTILISLRPNNWDDFGYKTLFHLSVLDADGTLHEIGDVKIGWTGQREDSWTHHVIENNTEVLDRRFFSLGQDASYYERLNNLRMRDEVLFAIKDIVAIPDSRAAAESTDEATAVFHTSLLRTVSITTLSEQYKRVLQTSIVRTPFNFRYVSPADTERAPLALDFEVLPNSNPPTNIHAIIGLNGVGKTMFLNNMVSCIIEDPMQTGCYGSFSDIRQFGEEVNHRYFSNLLSTSFSAFDSYPPPKNQNANDGQVSFHYIGLKDVFYEGTTRKSKPKDIADLSKDFYKSLQAFLGLQKKKKMWNSAIAVLSMDSNFPSNDLASFSKVEEPRALKMLAEELFNSLSSGHKVVLLTIAKIIERSEEKTLILMDEPENHLHPPLLSGFIRVISSVLSECNGVAIIATHSPVVLQEVPKSCVWKIRRNGLELRAERPLEETFGENVGMLTRDVFSLQVSQSGFHQLLKIEVGSGKSYDEIIQLYNGQIGLEGRAVLRALINGRMTG